MFTGGSPTSRPLLRRLRAVDAVRATGLVKRFGATTAVDGVDLAVAPGQVRGLLGPNGAGKTTLLRMLFGLIHPDAGSVELLGRPFDGLGGERPGGGGRVRGGAGLLPVPVRAREPQSAGKARRRPERGRGRRTRSHAWAWSGGARTAWRATRPGCASAWGSRPRCCARRDCCCWTSRRAGSTRAGHGPSRRSCASWPPRASRCCSRATRSASSSGSATLTPSCARGESSGTARRQSSSPRRRRPRTPWRPAMTSRR